MGMDSNPVLEVSPLHRLFVFSKPDLVTMLDKVRNEDIRQRMKQEAVVEVARKKQRAWKEKLDGMEVDMCTVRR